MVDPLSSHCQRIFLFKVSQISHLHNPNREFQLPTFLYKGCALLLGGALLFTTGCHRAEVKAAAAKPPEVFIANPTEDTVLEYAESTGRLVALNTVEIRSRVSGYLDKVFFKDGDDVKEGDTLFEIDQRPYQAELNRSQAAVVQSKSHLERLDRQLDRAKKLLRSKNMAQEDYDVIAFDRDEANASLAAAQASHEVAVLNMTFTRITARINGQISRRLVDPGNLVRADETPLTTLVSLDPIYAYFDVDERTLLRLQRLIQDGKISTFDSQVIVDVALADEDDYTLHGAINFLDNQVDPSTGTLRARAVMQNPKRMLSPGLFVRLRLPIGAPRKAVLVPEESLSSDQGQRFVYILNEKDEVVYRRVKVGWLTGGSRVIEEGLSPTDRIVVTGLQRVKPGTKVSPKPFGKPADPVPVASSEQPAATVTAATAAASTPAALSDSAAPAKIPPTATTPATASTASATPTTTNGVTTSK